MTKLLSFGLLALLLIRSRSSWRSHQCWCSLTTWWDIFMRYVSLTHPEKRYHKAPKCLSVRWCAVTCPVLVVRPHWSWKTWPLPAAKSESSLPPLLTSPLAWVSSLLGSDWLKPASFLPAVVVGGEELGLPSVCDRIKLECWSVLTNKVLSLWNVFCAFWLSWTTAPPAGLTPANRSM